MQTAMKKHKKRSFFPRLLLLCLLGGTLSILVPQIRGWFGRQDGSGPVVDSPVLRLASLPAADRAKALTEIVNQGGDRLSVSRAKYVLANDLIQQEQGSKALRYLEKLEQDYPTLASYVLWKRAMANELVGDRAAMENNLNQLITKYPNSPVAVEAFERLGKKNPKLWEQALQKFPQHPRSLTILGSLMEKEPRNTEPMFKYLKNGGTRFLKGVEIADKLSNEHVSILKPDDWRLIAEAYLQNGLLDRAALPLSHSPGTPENLLLLGKNARSTQKIPLAKATYRDLVDKYGNSEEAARALLELAEMSLNKAEAVNYLEQLAQKDNPELAATALSRKATFLKKTNISAAKKIQDEIVQRFPKSEAAAGIRWEQAWAQGSEGQYAKAWKQAKLIVTDSPDTRYSARAAYWIGKWAEKMGRKEDAKQAFLFTLISYTQSYYSWRAAQNLGLAVGDFQNLRSQDPKIVKTTANWPLPIGSPMLRELYQIGAYQDAWTLWQMEFPDREHYSVLEQFAEGVMLKSLERYQLGLARVSQLEKREKPAEVTDRQKVQQYPSYWQALYPLAYIDTIQSDAHQQKINPLLVLSVVRQESKFDPVTRSPAGALGLMQVLPSTADFIAPKLEMSNYDLRHPPDNIKLGTLYLADMHNNHKNNSLLAVSSYNAGPGNVAKWLQEIGLNDPDEFVENIPFDETQNYVRNVLGNYWNYLRTYNTETNQRVAKILDSHKK
jgi:soluble lytic murein transglycosylase